MLKMYLATTLLFSILFSFCYSQTVVVLQASRDNTIYSDLTNNSNGAGDNFTAGTTLLGSTRRGLLRFDLSTIPAGATVTNASLRLVLNKTATAGSTNISLYALNSLWGEAGSQATAIGDGVGVAAQAGDATWACSFADGLGGCTTAWTAGGAFQAVSSATTSVNTANAYTWSGSQMLANVQGWVNNSATNFGWILRADESTVQTAKRFSSRTNPVAADRPSLTVTYNSLVPVNLLNFKARATRFGNLLTWQTTQEVNNDYFDIEHSEDGIRFNSIGKEKGAGNFSGTLSYSYTHTGAIPGPHFYRLAQTDYDGRRTYSQIAYLMQHSSVKNIMISPNPVADRIHLPGLSGAGNNSYSILNLQGQVLAQSAFTGNSFFLPKELTRGIYLLRTWGANGEALTGTFLKQ